jgi:hypothetical protein
LIIGAGHAGPSVSARNRAFYELELYGDGAMFPTLSLVEKLEQHHLAEDELVIAGLNYLHQNVRWKRQK